MSLYPLRLCGTAAPYEDDGSATQDDVFDGARLGDGFDCEACGFSPGDVAVGFKTLAELFGALGVFFGVGNEDVYHDPIPPE